MELLVDGVCSSAVNSGNFREVCIFTKLRSEDVLSIERICASSGQSLYYILLRIGHCSGI